MSTSLNDFEKNRKRNIRKTLRMTEEELNIIQQRMKKAGITSLNEFTIQMAIKGFILIEDHDNLIEVSKEINFIGRNINQIAYKTNIANNAEIEELKAVLQELKKIKKIIADAFKKE